MLAFVTAGKFAGDVATTPLVGIERTFADGTVSSADGTVWTGTESNGAQGNHCGSWGINAAPNLGMVGNATSTNANWTEWAPAKLCNTTAHLYCFELIP